jgi:hypothetical protein
MKLSKQKISNLILKFLGIIFISVILGFSYNKIIDDKWMYQITVKKNDRLLSNLRSFDDLLVYLSIKPYDKSIDHYVVRDLNEYSDDVLEKFSYINNITLTAKYFVIDAQKKLNQDDLNELKDYINHFIKKFINQSTKYYYDNGVKKHEEYRLLQIQKITEFVSLYDKIIEEKVKNFEKLNENEKNNLSGQKLDSFNQVIVGIIDDFNYMLTNPSDENNLENSLLKITKKNDLVNTKIVRENVDIFIKQLENDRVSQDIFFVELKRLSNEIKSQNFFTGIKLAKITNQKVSFTTSILSFFVAIVAIYILIIYLILIFSKKSLQRKILSLLNRV